MRLEHLEIGFADGAGGGGEGSLAGWGVAAVEAGVVELSAQVGVAVLEEANRSSSETGIDFHVGFGDGFSVCVVMIGSGTSSPS